MADDARPPVSIMLPTGLLASKLHPILCPWPRGEVVESNQMHHRPRPSWRPPVFWSYSAHHVTCEPRWDTIIILLQKIMNGVWVDRLVEGWCLRLGTCEGLCPWCGVLHAAASFCTSFSGSRLPPLVAHLLRAASLMAAAGVDALHGTLH